MCEMTSISVVNPFLREWIDGATVQKFSGDCHSPAAETGFTTALFDHVLQLFSILVPLSPPTLSKKNARLLKELLGKVFLWGDGFRDGRLETIVDESDDLKETVVTELTRLGSLLISELVPTCEMLAPLPKRDEIRQIARELSILLEKAKLVSESDYDSDATSGHESDALPGVNESTKMISSIKTSIECLMELLPSMENALQYARQTNIDDEATSAVTFQVSGPAKTYVLKVYDKFTAADIRLVERLGEANWQRHTALRLGLTPQNPGLETPSTPATVFGGQEMPKSVFKPVSMFHDSGMGTTIAANSSYAVTVASHSSFVSSMADRDSGSLKVPPTPKEVIEGSPFTCDICGHTLSRIKNRVDWKRHVFADLKPYICTFNGCKDELLAFPTRKLWEEHEFTHHRVDRSWRCSDCPQTLLDPDQWRIHLQDHHGTVFSESQFDIACKMAEQRRPQPTKSHQCPLCLCYPGKSRRNFVTHVGKHMEGIALAALPRTSWSGSEHEGSEDSEAKTHTYQNEKMEKCPVQTCYYYIKGFARKYDRNRHTLTHYKGTMVCGFCPGSGSPAEKSFHRADVLKRHLTSVHAVEQTPPNSRRTANSNINGGKKLSGYVPDATGKCSTCSATFTNAQDFYEHLDDCVLRIVQQEEPSEAINARLISEVPPLNRITAERRGSGLLGEASNSGNGSMLAEEISASFPLGVSDQESVNHYSTTGNRESSDAAEDSSYALAGDNMPLNNVDEDDGDSLNFCIKCICGYNGDDGSTIYCENCST